MACVGMSGLEGSACGCACSHGPGTPGGVCVATTKLAVAGGTSSSRWPGAVQVRVDARVGGVGDPRAMWTVRSLRNVVIVVVLVSVESF